MKALLRHLLFNVVLMIAGSVIIESDIVTGHNDIQHFRNAAIHYVEKPKEEDNDE